MTEILLRIRMTDAGIVLLPPCAEDDLPGLLRRLVARREALRPRFTPLLQPLWEEGCDAFAAALPALEAGPGQVVAVTPTIAPSEALLKLAPAQVLGSSLKLNHLIDDRAAGADDRLVGILRGFDPEEIKHAAVVRAHSFAGGRLFLTRRNRHQWLEVNRRFKLLPDEVRASVGALGLSATWEAIALLNDHFARLIGIDPDSATPDAPTEEPAEEPVATRDTYGEALTAAQIALNHLILLANRVHTTDPALAADLLAPWLELQREYAEARRRG